MAYLGALYGTLRRTLPYQFELPISDFNDSVLPPGCPKKGSDGYSAAVHSYLAQQFHGFEGDARIVVDEDRITVEWEPRSKGQSLLDAALAKLNVGDIEPAIAILELLLNKEPINIVILFNLGMAYSDQGNLDDAIRVLSRALEIDPDHVNARIALGVALARAGDFFAAHDHLQDAVDDHPSNSFAHRNLAAVLVQLGKSEEAIKHFRWAIDADPNDQQARLGLADVLRFKGDKEEADAQFRRVVEIDPTTQFADLARKTLSEIAVGSFRDKADGNLRQDVVYYCLAALKLFDGMDKDEIRKIAYEIAILGTQGLEINDSTQKYTLRSLPGQFSGTHLLSYLYVGFKIISPDQDYPFDVAEEYALALRVFEEGKRRG